LEFKANPGLKSDQFSMPTIGVKRDLLFEALGKTYSEFEESTCNHVFIGWSTLMFTPFPQPMMSSRIFALPSDWSWMKW